MIRIMIGVTLGINTVFYFKNVTFCQHKVALCEYVCVLCIILPLKRLCRMHGQSYALDIYEVIFI